MAKATLETVRLWSTQHITTWGSYGNKSVVMDWDAIKDKFLAWREWMENEENDTVTPHYFADVMVNDIAQDLYQAQIDAMIKIVSSMVFDKHTDRLTDDLKSQLEHYDNLSMAEIQYRHAIKDTSPKAFYIVLMELLALAEDQIVFDSADKCTYSITIDVYEYETAGAVTSTDKVAVQPVAVKSKADDLFV